MAVLADFDLLQGFHVQAAPLGIRNHFRSGRERFLPLIPNQINIIMDCRDLHLEARIELGKRLADHRDIFAIVTGHPQVANQVNHITVKAAVHMAIEILLSLIFGVIASSMVAIWVTTLIRCGNKPIFFQDILPGLR